MLQNVDVISANVKDLGPLSLDSFKRNNGSASWKVVGLGQENSDDASLEVGYSVTKSFVIYFILFVAGAVATTLLNAIMVAIF